MNSSQRTRLYFPAWHRAAQAQGWLMRKGRLIGERAESYGLAAVNTAYQSVWDAALARAAREHRAPTARDLRYACHFVALGRYCSSKTLTNGQIDRLLPLLELLVDPNNLDAMARWLHPELATAEAMQRAITRYYDPGYVAALARAVFQAADWRALPPDRLAGIFRLLRDRPNAQRPIPIQNSKCERENAAPTVSAEPF